MIDSISQMSGQNLFNNSIQGEIKMPQVAVPQESLKISKPQSAEPFGNVLGKLVQDVAEKQNVAQVETNRMLLGETDNIHQSMLAVQEAGLAFTTLVEVRNKLVTSYQELMRMPV